MKQLLEWIDAKRAQHGTIVIFLAALLLFTLLAIVLAVVYAFFIGLMYINPYLVLPLTLLLLIMIIYLNRR